MRRAGPLVAVYGACVAVRGERAMRRQVCAEIGAAVSDAMLGGANVIEAAAMGVQSRAALLVVVIGGSRLGVRWVRRTARRAARGTGVVVRVVAV